MATDDSASRLLGKEIGGCRIRELLGTGGMGAVYLATQLALGKEVALKILDEHWAARTEHVDGFLREARLAARLEDEHIVQIYDVGSDSSYHYIVMQLARGENLKDRLKRGPLEIEEALRYVEGVARGLSVAHRHGVVHRDIKPGNLVIGEDGIIKVLDFGLARAEQTDSDKSQGQFMGSVAYMAPEQSEYMPVDARTDIYSLGVTAYQCFTGQLPFRAEQTFDLLLKHHCERPAAPNLLRRELPLTLSRVILRMIAKAAEDRYKDVDDLLVDLKLIRRHQLPATPSPWSGRPLNPRPIDLRELDSRKLYHEGLRTQRNQFSAGDSVTPLRDILPRLGVKERQEGEPALWPPSFIELLQGERRLSLEQVIASGFGASSEGEAVFEYGERFRLFLRDGRLIIRVKGSKPLGIDSVQRLFDLLEALPDNLSASIAHLAVALESDYMAQGSDVRWVVDTYNILDKRGCALTLIVGSMDNHTTFVNLGIDRHIKLELELEGPSTLSLERLRPEHPAGAETTEGESPAEAVTPAARALVARIRELAADGDSVGAARAWRRLASEGFERRELAKLKDLRDLVYEKLLAEGKEAFDADDHDTATERFNLLIDIDPGRYEGHFYKGLLLKADGKMEYAQAFLTQAILAAPDEPELFYHRAIVRSRVEDFEGALRDLDMALQHNPRFVKAYYNRAKLHKLMGRPDLVKRDLVMYGRLRDGGSRGSKAPVDAPKVAGKD